MPPVIRSAQEEAAFLSGLLTELDDAVWYAPSTPHPSPPKLRNSDMQTAQTFTTPVKTKSRNISRSPKPALPSPSKVFSANDADIETMLKGIGQDWEWDMNEISPKKIKVVKTLELAGSRHITEICTRGTVEFVTSSDTDGRISKNLVVVLESGERRSVILHDDWVSTDVQAQDIINVIGTFESHSQSSSSLTSSIVISSKQNLLIHHPDLLITTTAVSTAASCRRRPILSSLIRSSNDVSPALVWGHILHTVVQACLSEHCWTDQWLNAKIDEVVRENLADLVRIRVNVETAVREVKSRAKGVQSFFDKYMSATPKSNATLNNSRAGRNETALLAISELLDVEEDIWSPTYGLKGKLDATVQTSISQASAPGKLSFSKANVTRGPKPLEIKTGRATAGMEHRAQTMLYNLLAQERYGIDVASGLLYYTQSEEVVQVPVSRNELRGLILARNEIAMYMHRRQTKPQEPFLPPTIDDERTCKRCYALDVCMLYRRTVEQVEDETSPIADVYSLKTSHLTPLQSDFFKKWDNLLALEEQDVGRFRKELWTMGAAERENHGRCFASMALDSTCTPSLSKRPNARDKIHSFTYRFIRSPCSASKASFLNGFLDVNDAITISVEPHLLALARGFILELTPTAVVVGVDHDLSVDHLRPRLAVYDATKVASTQSIIFRIDRDEMHGGMSRIRDNLAQLFYVGGNNRRLQLIVDSIPPQFDDSPLTSIPPSAENHLVHLNSNQRQAIDKVLRAQDYALVLGMPGTGKTTMVAALIKGLVDMGKTVLLTSYTHSAVDTILAKLSDATFSILRLGNVNRDVRKYTLAHQTRTSTVEQLEHKLMSPPVVATTCLSIDDAVFARRRFDYCIVDEASQITLPTCIGPLRFAEKFVLVGDHFQLPPLVRNRDARKGGLDVSLFRHLSNAHPHAVVDLACQYRMNEDIMLLSNKLIYHDRLRCGSDAVARRSLSLPGKSFLHTLHTEDSRCKGKGYTDLVPASDSRVGDLIQNEKEARIVYQITETLVKSGVSPTDIGVISLYRQQIKLLSQYLQSHKGLEFFTADKSQGRDKECIIISMVRSNESSQIGELVKDWRRMNVSFTRARSKLIIIGSRRTLRGAPLLREFFVLMESQGWILRLPAGADLLHSEALETKWSGSKRGTSNDENTMAGQTKKLKSRDGFLRGRPILQDLVNDTK
ncbi:hypothetical protein D9757_010828 [Collybiopsis confluens]|uniref:DNA helicase n=1 Tax=Collybiopsis confluens TaxID=2823264 RepID=A0A8H5GLE8_9AGAR|nr:hypothetical protein D9757_010828 [Collybiopsis confluens]